MRTKARAVAVLLLAVAIGSAGCIRRATPLERAARRGEAAVERCEGAYASLYAAWKAGRVSDEDREKGLGLYKQALDVAPQLGQELKDAREKPDDQLAAAGRAAKVEAHIDKLNALAGQIEALNP